MTDVLVVLAIAVVIIPTSVAWARSYDRDPVLRDLRTRVISGTSVTWTPDNRRDPEHCHAGASKPTTLQRKAHR